MISLVNNNIGGLMDTYVLDITGDTKIGICELVLLLASGNHVAMVWASAGSHA